MYSLSYHSLSPKCWCLASYLGPGGEQDSGISSPWYSLGDSHRAMHEESKMLLAPAAPGCPGQASPSLGFHHKSAFSGAPACRPRVERSEAPG